MKVCPGKKKPIKMRPAQESFLIWDAFINQLYIYSSSYI